MAEEVESLSMKRKQKFERKLNTKGCCFLCLALIRFKTEEGSDEGGKTNSVSLKLLRRYLNINLEDFSKLTSAHCKKTCGVGEVDVKVDLCVSCSGMITKTSKLLLSLEKIEMEVKYWLTGIHQKIYNSSKQPELVQNYSKQMTSDPKTLTQLAFVDQLRNEISKTSLEKSNTGQDANVKLERIDLSAFKKRQVNAGKIKTSTADPPHILRLATTDTEEPHIGHLIKCERQEEYDAENGLEQTPPSLLPHSPPGPSIVTEKTECKGRSRQRKQKTESGIKSCFNSKTGKYVCTKCKKEFTRPDHARRHYDAIHLQRKWKCDICNVSVFSHPQSLTGHKKTCRDKVQQRLETFNAKQNDPRYKFGCSTCGKRFKLHSQMMQHNRIVHLKEKNHACDLCDKTFLIASNLRDHKNAVHLGITSKCGTCNMEFKYRINHLRHERNCEGKSAVTC